MREPEIQVPSTYEFYGTAVGGGEIYAAADNPVWPTERSLARTDAGAEASAPRPEPSLRFMCEQP